MRCCSRESKHLLVGERANGKLIAAIAGRPTIAPRRRASAVVTVHFALDKAFAALCVKPLAGASWTG